jgi:magnesium-protoporphyrin O-methyltransferase
LARERYAQDAVQGPGSIQFLAGDMLSPATGEFDYVVGMDSLIHYDTPDIVKAVHGLSLRTRRAILFTFAPRTPLLAVMHSVGRLFPRSDRSPALAPVSAVDLNLGLETVLQGTTWQAGRSQRISSGFYTSQAWEWRQA